MSKVSGLVGWKPRKGSIPAGLKRLLKLVLVRDEVTPKEEPLEPISVLFFRCDDFFLLHNMPTLFHESRFWKLYVHDGAAA